MYLCGMDTTAKSYIKNLGFESLTDMQDAIYDEAKSGKDIVLLSPTGSGKTLGFLLPLIERLDKNISGVQALIVSPTRELALQIEDVFKQLKTPFKVNLVYGGHSIRTEKQSLTEPPALLIGTPGRLCDHIGRETIDFSQLKCLVLDEFDKSLEMGFQDDMGYIIDTLPSHQTILSSATFLDDIPGFVGVKEPVEVNFLKESQPAVKQWQVSYEEDQKVEKLVEVICAIPAGRTIVFCNHREATERVCEHLNDMGIPAIAFHGAMEQDERERTIIKFRNGTAYYLIATDLAARGLDIPEIETVIHYQLPHKEAVLTHRNGRTARMNGEGNALIFLSNESKQLDYIPTDLPEYKLPKNGSLPEFPQWETIYFSGGKKDKVNKIDLVGFLMQKGKLKKDEVGLITVLDYTSFVAVKESEIKQLMGRIKGEKVKGKKLKIQIAR
ncbi:MAG: ATP-dependent RNA helicase DeaD [Lentimonas sp.]|jgi:ATP-dependent RNA helicase DeaD